MSTEGTLWWQAGPYLIAAVKHIAKVLEVEIRRVSDSMVASVGGLHDEQRSEWTEIGSSPTGRNTGPKAW